MTSLVACKFRGSKNGLDILRCVFDNMKKHVVILICFFVTPLAHRPLFAMVDFSDTAVGDCLEGWRGVGTEKSRRKPASFKLLQTRVATNTKDLT